MINKTIWVIANWKSNKTIAEALEWVEIVGPQVERRENLRVVVCPTFDAIAEVKKACLVGNFPLMVGSQDLSPFGEGAYTGAEPATILKQFVQLSILGHSERRQNFAETDQMVEQKVEQAKLSDIIPLVCVQGEKTPVPKGCNLIAYEPIFAIGTGNPDTPQNASMVAEAFKKKYSSEMQVLYGGSVNSENCQAFIKQDHINGLLIGKASLSSTEFLKIIQECLY